MAPLALRIIERVSTIMALVAGASVLLLSLLIAFDILARRLLHFSLQGTDELGGYALALVGSLGLTYTLLQRGHPRIDIALRRFPAPLRGFLHVIAYAALCGFAIFMTVHAAAEFTETLAFGTITNTPLQTPLWVPQAFWVFGTAAFALVTFGLTLHAGLLFVRAGDDVERLYGPITVEEEVHDYVGDGPVDASRAGG